MVWYGMWHGIGMSLVWYGFYIPWYGGIGMELIYHCWNGCPLGALNQGIEFTQAGDYDWIEQKEV